MFNCLLGDVDIWIDTALSNTKSVHVFMCANMILQCNWNPGER